MNNADNLKDWYPGTGSAFFPGIPQVISLPCASDTERYEHINDVVRRFSDARLGKADRTMPCLPCTRIFIAYRVAARPHFDRVVVVADGVDDVGL